MHFTYLFSDILYIDFIFSPSRFKENRKDDIWLVDVSIWEKWEDLLVEIKTVLRSVVKLLGHSENCLYMVQKKWR